MVVQVINRKNWGAADSKKPLPGLRKPVLYVVIAYSRRDIKSGGKYRPGKVADIHMRGRRPHTLAPSPGSPEIDYVKAMQRLQQNDMRLYHDIRYK